MVSIGQAVNKKNQFIVPPLLNSIVSSVQCVCVKMLKKIFCFFSVVFLLGEIDGHASNLDNCPTVKPMTDFDIKEMLGVWYVMQRTSTETACIHYNISKLEKPNHYNLEQVNLDFVPVKREHRHTGELIVPNPAVPGKMKIIFPLNETENASFVVFMTDYSNYAGIFTCQEVGHKQSVVILSRTRVIPTMYVSKIRAHLEKDLIDPPDLSLISHTYCTKDYNGPEEYYVYSDDYTLSSHKMLSGYRNARRAEETIEDGVYSPDGIKKFSIASQKMTETLNKEVHDVKTLQNAHVHEPTAPSRTLQIITKTPSTESSRTIYTSFANDNE